MVPGRSAAALETWLAAQEPNFRSRIQRIAMDGFAGYHRAAADAIPQARTVMDPLACRASGGGEDEPVPSTCPAGDDRSSGQVRRPALRNPQTPSHPLGPAD